MQKGERMKEYELRQCIMMSSLKPMEKIVMLAILMRVDWTTFKGQVSVNQIVELTNSTKPTIKRIISSLIKKGCITRTSKHLEPTKSTAAYTTIKLESLGIKTDTGIKVDTGIKSDTHTVSKPIPPGIKSDTPNSIKTDTHTISNNINPITNNKEKPEPHGDNQVDQLARERENEFWIYPSSIEDPELRRRTERHIQRNPQMPYSERQRLLYPQLTKSISCKRRTHEVDKRST